MGYLHINNLYKDQTILLFKECYALEKVHGTSAHISLKETGITAIQNGVTEHHDFVDVTFFSGGEKHARFVSLFDKAKLLEAFKAQGFPKGEIVTVYGEAYGGSQQGMSATYGKDLKFVVFDVKVGNVWLSVPQAEDVAKKLGLEFVYYTRIPTTVEALDAARDADSQQAIRNGMGAGKKMEGVVLRPIIEVTLNNGNRVITKHKRDEFRETASPRVVDDPEKLKVLADAEAIANEWVTPMRLQHVLDKIKHDNDMKNVPIVIAAMVEDVYREGDKEIIPSDAVKKAIGKRTVTLFKDLLKAQIK